MTAQHQTALRLVKESCVRATAYPKVWQVGRRIRVVRAAQRNPPVAAVDKSVGCASLTHPISFTETTCGAIGFVRGNGRCGAGIVFLASDRVGHPPRSTSLPSPRRTLVPTVLRGNELTCSLLSIYEVDSTRQYGGLRFADPPYDFYRKRLTADLASFEVRKSGLYEIRLITGLEPWVRGNRPRGVALLIQRTLHPRFRVRVVKERNGSRASVNHRTRGCRRPSNRDRAAISGHSHSQEPTRELESAACIGSGRSGCCSGRCESGLRMAHAVSGGRSVGQGRPALESAARATATPT